MNEHHTPDRQASMLDDFEWVDGRRPRGPVYKSGIMLSLRANEKTGQRFLTIAIYSDVMKEMRWVVGDRAVVGVSTDGRKVAIRRTVNGGYMMGARSRKGEIGKSGDAGLRVPVPPRLEIESRTRFSMDGIEIHEGMIVLDLDSIN